MGNGIYELRGEFGFIDHGTLTLTRRLLFARAQFQRKAPPQEDVLRLIHRHHIVDAIGR